MTKSIKKPWGNEKQFSENEKTTVKILTVLPGRPLSLQYHDKRREVWRVLDGDCKIIIGEKEFAGKKDKEFRIPKKTRHRIIGGKNTAKILEISYGTYDKDDIVRIEDKYKR
ncbi:MAG: phosphomannose isomerase type II C-terminal cupin domain [Nanobdellota archaeon]